MFHLVFLSEIIFLTLQFSPFCWDISQTSGVPRIVKFLIASGGMADLERASAYVIFVFVVGIGFVASLVGG